jgi:hypothetical protein
MRLFFSLTSFAFTMILALIAFTYTAIHFPTTMRDLLAGAKHVQEELSLLGLPDSYMVWVDIFLQPNQIVLVGYSIAMRLAISLISSLTGVGGGGSGGGVAVGGAGGGESEAPSSSQSKPGNRYRDWRTPPRGSAKASPQPGKALQQKSR